MKTTLSHLPKTKQEQILQVAEIIKEVAQPEKIILFGSYAKGNYVEDSYLEGSTRLEYISDFDLLVVLNTNDEKEFIIKDRIITRTRTLFKTPVNPIIHSLEYVNEGLEIGQYFFCDIINEGVLIFENNSRPFSSPRILTSKEKKEIAQRYLEQWFNSGKALLNSAKFNFREGEFKLAAFELHQAAERLYNAVLLIFTNYKPKTHNLDILRQYCKNLSKDLFLLFPFPSEDENETFLFDLIKRSYIEARYKDDFKITKQQLKILINRISVMVDIVERICSKKISHLS